MSTYAELKGRAGADDVQAYLDGAATYAEQRDQRLSVDLPKCRQEIEQQARLYSSMAGAIHAGGWDDEERRVHLIALCDLAGVAFPRSKFGLGPSVLRMQEPKWWVRKLATVERRRWEHAQQQAGKVRKGRQIYCTDIAVADWRAMRARNAEFCQQMFVFNDDQWIQNLAEIAAHSLANPAVRRAEMFARLRGMEAYANECGNAGLFVTLTCPSRMHPSSPRYDGTTPKEAQEHLCRMWSQARAKLDRDGVTFYGFRIAEPHHDGCPHWHLLLFTVPCEVFRVAGVLRKYALKVDGNEAGARVARCKVEHIDPAKGSAVAYVAKYISKNIDGKKSTGETIGAVNDRDGTPIGDGADLAERVLAWSSLWGIRQFQQVGGERIGPYRELRRVHQIITASAVLEAARLAADAGDFAAYQKAAQEMAVQTMKRCDALEALRAGDEDGAREALNQYMEPVWRVVGVMGDGCEIVTRRDDWRCLTEAAIHAMYEAADTQEAVEFWGEICELVNLLRAEREHLGSPPGGPLDPC